MEGWIKLHRQLTEWEWYDDGNTFRLFIHLLLKCNHEDNEWRGIKILKGQTIIGRIKLSQELKISEQSIRTSLDRLKSTNEITIKTTNKYSIITIVSWNKYQESNQQDNKQVTNDQPITNHKQEGKELKNDKNISSKEDTVVKKEYGNSEINNMLEGLKKIVGVSSFTESEKIQRGIAKHIVNLGLSKEDFENRLKVILSDDFKAKNCNSISYLYRQLKGFIHSPVIKTGNHFAI